MNTSVWTYRGEATLRNGCLIDSSAVNMKNGYVRISIYTGPNAQGQQTTYCGAITTQGGSFLHTYGYWEAGVRFQTQQGNLCAFWLQSPTTGSIVGNPQQSGTEMDILEHNPTIESASGYDHAVIWNGYTRPYYQVATYTAKQSNLNDGNFHDVGLAWTPGNLTFYVDGQETWTLSASDAAISDIAEYIILDTELSSASSAPPAASYGPLGSSSNAYMDVDYVRVYPYTTNVVSTTLYDVADAYVQDGSYAAENLAGSTTLKVQGDTTGNNQNAYLKFDLSQIAGTVLQATLYLTPVSVGSGNITNTLNYVADNSWTAGGITWNDQPQTSGQLSTGISFGPNILTNIDVTAQAKAGQTLSLQVAPDTPTGSATWVDYGSEENPTVGYRPRLVVISSAP